MNDSYEDMVRADNRIVLLLGAILAVFMLSMVFVSATSITDGLEAYYKLDETTGLVASDFSGNGNDGTMVGYTFNHGVINGGVTIEDGAMAFNGTGGYVKLGEGETFEDIKTAFTISAWIKPTSFNTSGNFPTQQVIFSKFRSITNERKLAFVLDNGNGTLSIYAKNEDDESWGGYPSSSTETVSLDEWSFVSASWDGTTLTFYINGVAKGSTAVSDSLLDGNTTHVFIGARSNTGTTPNSSFFEGSINDVQVYNRGLTSDEIEAQYNAGRGSYALSGNGLVAQYSGRDYNTTHILDTNPVVKGTEERTLQGKRFDGANTHYINTGIDGNTIVGEKDFTFSAWTKATTFVTGKSIISHRGTGILNGLTTTAGNKFTLNLYDGSVKLITSNVVNPNQWYHVVGTYKYSTKTGELFVNGISQGTLVTTNYPTSNTNPLGIGNTIRTTTWDYELNGSLDEVGVWSRALTEEEILYLYESSPHAQTSFTSEQVSGTTDQNITLSCTSINECKAVNYNINNEGWNIIQDIIIKNMGLSSSSGTGTSWKTGPTNTLNLDDLHPIDTEVEMLSGQLCIRGEYNFTPVSAYVRYNYSDSTTSNSNTISATGNSITCHDLTTKSNPAKTLVSTTIFHKASTDNHHYVTGGNIEYTYKMNTFTDVYPFIYSGAGDHNIQFYSTDNADNNETIKTSTFNTSGLAKFTFFDEDTENLLNDVVWTVSPSINGVSGGTLTDSNVLDLNLQGITSQEYTFTFTKTGYGPRTYVRTLNQYSDIDLNFALLSNSLSDDIPFKIYQTDETTIYTNTIVELYRPDNNFVIGRKKTNSTGNVTFSIHVSDQNYYVRVDDGAFTYQPVALTIYYPKNEETLLQITEDWKIEITQNLYETYSDLNADKIIYLLPNTSLPFNIRISDMNGNFFTRTYAQQFFGDPRTAELQPYLVSTTTGLLTTITTKDATTNTNIGGVTIKIYKFISGEGRTLVEQVITDAKGQAITLLIAGAEYSFECYYGGVLIKTFEITSTSTTIFIMLDLGSIIEVPDPSGYQATFTPKGTGLINQGVGTVAFTQTMYNYGGKTISLTSRILQGGVVISQQTANTSLTSYTFTHTINWTDINQTTITSRIIINDGTTNYTFNQNYNITTFFDTNYSILDGLQNGLRRDFTCDPSGICFPLLALAIFISIALVIGATIGMGQFGVQSVAIIFLSSMMLFTYLNWVPFILTIVLAVLTFAFIVSERSV